MAVRLHDNRHPERHDPRRPRRARPHRQADGGEQRLPAAAGERPVHHVGHDPRLHVRHVPDVLVHVRAVRHATTRTTRRSRARPAGTRTRSCTWPSAPGARSASSATRSGMARCGAFDDDLEVVRGWTSNPDGTDTATSGKFSRANPDATSSSGTEAADRRPVGLAGVRHGRRRRVLGERERPRRPDVGPESRRSSCRSATGQRLFFRYVFAHGSNSSSADNWWRASRRLGRPRPRSSRSPARPPMSTACGAPSPPPLDAWAGQTIRIHFDGGRWREQQPGRGRDRRRAGHAGVVDPAGPVAGRSPGLRSLRRMRLALAPPDAARRHPPTPSDLGLARRAAILGRGVDSWRAAARWPVTAARWRAAGRDRPAERAANQPTRKPASKASPAPVVSAAMRCSVATSKRRFARRRGRGRWRPAGRA